MAFHLLTLNPYADLSGACRLQQLPMPHLPCIAADVPGHIPSLSHISQASASSPGSVLHTMQLPQTLPSTLLLPQHCNEPLCTFLPENTSLLPGDHSCPVTQNVCGPTGTHSGDEAPWGCSVTGEWFQLSPKSTEILLNCGVGALCQLLHSAAVGRGSQRDRGDAQEPQLFSIV